MSKDAVLQATAIAVNDVVEWVESTQLLKHGLASFIDMCLMSVTASDVVGIWPNATPYATMLASNPLPIACRRKCTILEVFPYDPKAMGRLGDHGESAEFLTELFDMRLSRMTHELHSYLDIERRESVMVFDVDRMDQELAQVMVTLGSKAKWDLEGLATVHGAVDIIYHSRRYGHLHKRDVVSREPADFKPNADMPIG
jgi:hypothetical protein